MLEASDPAAALVEFARRNGVDQIVMGARAASAPRRYLGSVSARVVAEAGMHGHGSARVTVSSTLRHPVDEQAEPTPVSMIR